MIMNKIAGMFNSFLKCGQRDRSIHCRRTLAYERLAKDSRSSIVTKTVNASSKKKLETLGRLARSNE